MEGVIKRNVAYTLQTQVASHFKYASSILFLGGRYVRESERNEQTRKYRGYSSLILHEIPAKRLSPSGAVRLSSCVFDIATAKGFPIELT